MSTGDLIMTKKLSGIALAGAVATSNQLALLSVEQAKTYFKMSIALASERLKLLTPPSDAFDIRRLECHMIELANELIDPILALNKAATQFQLDRHPRHGETRPQPTLIQACKIVFEEIQCAKDGISENIKKDAEEEDRQTVSLNIEDVNQKKTSRPSSL